MGLFGSGFGLPQALSGLTQQRRQPEDYQDMPPVYQQQANPLQGIGDLGTSLMAAQAAIDGDFGASAQLSQSIGAQQRAMAQQAAKAAQDRKEWVWRQQYERDNPKPTNNDTVADYEFWKSKLSPEQFQTYVQNKVDPPQYRQGADGQFYRISPTPATPTPWQQNPGDWEMVPGPTQGGAGPQTPQPFPRNIPSGNPLIRPRR